MYDVLPMVVEWTLLLAAYLTWGSVDSTTKPRRAVSCLLLVLAIAVFPAFGEEVLPGLGWAFVAILVKFRFLSTEEIRLLFTADNR